MVKKLVAVLLLVILMVFTGCGRKPSKTAQGYWDSAVMLFDGENYQGCIDQYQNLIKFYPEDTLVIRTLFAMAEIYKNNLNDLDNSIAIYKKITDQYSDSEKAPNAMFMIGYIYANDLKDYDKAKESYNKFLTTYPNHMLVPSARWELQNLGRSLDEIPQLQVITKNEK